MDAAEAMPAKVPKNLSHKDYPATSSGISRALTNTIAARAPTMAPWLHLPMLVTQGNRPWPGQRMS
jgi:hypothetical protein